MPLHKRLRGDYSAAARWLPYALRALAELRALGDYLSRVLRPKAGVLVRVAVAGDDDHVLIVTRALNLLTAGKNADGVPEIHVAPIESVDFYTTTRPVFQDGRERIVAITHIGDGECLIRTFFADSGENVQVSRVYRVTRGGTGARFLFVVFDLEFFATTPRGEVFYGGSEAGGKRLFKFQLQTIGQYTVPIIGQQDIAGTFLLSGRPVPDYAGWRAVQAPAPPALHHQFHKAPAYIGDETVVVLLMEEHVTDTEVPITCYVCRSTDGGVTLEKSPSSVLTDNFQALDDRHLAFRDVSVCVLEGGVISYLALEQTHELFGDPIQRRAFTCEGTTVTRRGLVLDEDGVPLNPPHIALGGQAAVLLATGFAGTLDPENESVTPFLVRTLDGGDSWERIDPAEFALLRWYQTGHLVLLARGPVPTDSRLGLPVYRDGEAVLLVSRDGGLTWGEEGALGAVTLFDDEALDVSVLRDFTHILVLGQGGRSATPDLAWPRRYNI
jgi:hypothetical protein